MDTYSHDSSTDLGARSRYRRAVEAAIWGMPLINYDLIRQEMLGKTAGQVNGFIYWGRPLDWHNQTLTPNPDTLYFMAFYDTRQDGPLVLEIPPGDAAGSLNCNIVTSWQMPLEDAGLLGADRGAGARYLVLPPGYDQGVPEGYVALQSDVFGGFILVRSNLASHADDDVRKSLAYGKRVKLYPLAQAVDPPPIAFTDVQQLLFDATIGYDTRLFEGLDRVVQQEPWLARDRLMIDLLRSVGIEKGQPFAPDAAARELLDAAARETHAWRDNLYDAGLPPFWDGSRWTQPARPDLVRAQQSGWTDGDRYPVESRGLTYTYGYVGIKRLGVGQMYLITIRDRDGDPFDGARHYRLHVPPAVPVEQYWSVTAYDRDTHALIRNMERASRSSQVPDLRTNRDGSVDIHFGPSAPAGLASNWVPTDPARRFDAMFRLYGPTGALFDKSWVLPDIEKA